MSTLPQRLLAATMTLCVVACGTETDPPPFPTTQRPADRSPFGNAEDSDARPQTPAPAPAPASEPVAPETTADVPPPEDVATIVARDYAALPAGARADTRYISIAHLATDLDVIRFGMEKALNSVSTAPRIAKLSPLDPARTVYRMALPAFAWTPDTFTLLQRAPHASDNLQLLPEGAIIARGDWLVFAITRPEVYDRILKLPPLESMLEARLGIRDRSKAVYLGVSDSIVTYNSRVLERIPIQHVTGEGYYWRSYDWLFQSTAQRAFDLVDPTYATRRGIADLIAGEFIFSLPNGFQAYMLSGFGSQHRFDAQAAVARDGRREDRLVINGESCMTCHAAGLNSRRDEIRPRFEANAARYDAVSLARFRQLFPPQAEIDALFRQDNARFAAAVAALGYGLAVEPIGETIERFKQDRGLRDVRQQTGETDAVLGN